MEPINYPYPYPDPGDREPIGGPDVNPAYRGPVPFRENVRLLRALERALPGYNFYYDPYAGGYFLTSPINDRETDPFLVFGSADDFGDDSNPGGWRVDPYLNGPDAGCWGPEPGEFGIVVPGAGFDPAGFPALARELERIAVRFGIVPATAAVAG